MRNMSKIEKIRLEEELHKESIELREINFREAAAKAGFKHVKTEDVRIVAMRFLKKHPSYRGVRFVLNPEKGPSSTESLFTTLVLTELEYMTEADMLKEVGIDEEGNPV